MGDWTVWSIPIYAALTINLKGRAKVTALWIYLWCLAGDCFFATWHFYTIHQQLTSLMPDDPRHQTEAARTIWIGGIVTAILLVVPVVWYRRELRKENVEANANQTA